MNTKSLRLFTAVPILFLLSCSGEDKEFEKRAYKNLDKIQVGDDSFKVLKIMGEPKEKYYYSIDSNIRIFSYGRITDRDIDVWDMTVRFNVSDGKVRGKSYGEKGNSKR